LAPRSLVGEGNKFDALSIESPGRSPSNHRAVDPMALLHLAVKVEAVRGYLRVTGYPDGSDWLFRPRQSSHSVHHMSRYSISM
jgi:hypothetical protein